MILYEAEVIRGKIKDVLAAKNGRRYAIVAFVGRDALDFVHEPKGLIVYCWPNVAATNPDGIKGLIGKGAKVYFVDRLHMKLFWSERGGAVVGSCNLTQNGLGDGASSLREMAYFTPDASQVQVDQVLKAVRASRREVTGTELAAYRKKYNAAAARRDEWKSGKQEPKGGTFTEYMRQSLKGDQRLITTWWRDYEEKMPGAIVKAVRESEEQSESRAPENFIRDYVYCKRKPNRGDWVLTCRLGTSGTYGRLDWVFTHVVAKRRANSDVWAAIQLKRKTEDPPFDCKDDRFVEVFHRYAKETNLKVKDTFTLTAPRLARIAALFKSV
jgi:hypothetical protein